MVTFIDPRTDPKACVTKPAQRTTTDLDVRAELHALCRTGRLCDVERLIQAGRQLQAVQGITVSAPRTTA